MLRQYGHCYAITGRFTDRETLVEATKAVLNQGVRILQLRSKSSKADYMRETESLLPLMEQYQAQLFLNTDLATWQQVEAIAPQVGLHLASEKAAQFEHRMIPTNVPLSMSVHNQQQLVQANKLQADIVLLSPVLPTASHPELAALGWKKAQSMCVSASMSVFALGGVAAQDLDIALEYGFAGVAGIGAFWPK